MFQTSKIKLVALTLIYVLHVAFFDGIMAHGSYAGKISCFASAHNQSSKNSNSSGGSSYRLLIKHEQAKQKLVNIPSAFDFVSTAFTCFIKEQITQSQFGASAHLGVNTFKLYRLYRVFLI